MAYRALSSRHDRYSHLFPGNVVDDEQCLQSAKQPTIFITSITRPFRDHAHSRQWRNTLWQSSRKPPQFPLWVYNENTWEVQHHRKPLVKEDLPVSSCMFDVFQVSSKDSALHNDASINAFYEIPGTPGLNDRIMDGKVLVRKVAAIAHAMSIVTDGTLVIWLDVDVVFTKRELDQAFFDFVLSKDVSYLAETTCWRSVNEEAVDYSSLPDSCLDFRVDTGIVAFRASELTRRFTKWWLDSYSTQPGRMLALAQHCLENKPQDTQPLLEFFARDQSRHHNMKQDICHLPYIRSSIGMNDIHTFALALHSFGSEIKHGWLAYKTTSCDGDITTNRLPSGHCHPCRAREKNMLVSQICACDYLVHIKGGSAIMARQHTTRSEEEIKQVMTTDRELLLPDKYFPINTHIDHRMACGDKRGKYGEIWSLNQL